MSWSAEPGAGFTARGVEPWGSALHPCRELIALRRREPDLRTGAYAQVPAPPGAWVFRRGERALVALNVSNAPVAVEGVAGTVAVGTDRRRDGEAVAGTLVLGPWEGAVVLTAR